MKVNKRVLIIILGCVIALAISSLLNFTYYEEYKLFYSSEDFGITVIKRIDPITGHFRWNAKDLEDVIVYFK